MNTESLATFVLELRSTNLLEGYQLEEVSGELQKQFPEPHDLAGQLMRRGWLTSFQAEQLLTGRGKSLVLGQYFLLERLGEGGMGEVFKARHRLMNRIVALKVIRQDKLASPGAINRFHQEIRAAAQLSHPNVVIAHDANREGDTHFFVMEYVEGKNLTQVIKERGPLPPWEACEYIRQTALGLQHAHERGMVHRDIKPSNLLLTAPPPGREGNPGTVKILDMGLARLNHPDDSAPDRTALTQEGAVIGTPDYIAPEQATDSHTVDIRADLYSLGCTMYFLLAGRPPFPKGSMLEKLFQQRFEEPERLDKICAHLPSEVAAVAQKLMAKLPEDRYQIPGEVAQALAPWSQAAHYPAPVQADIQRRGALGERLSVTAVSGDPSWRPQTKRPAHSTSLGTGMAYPPTGSQTAQQPVGTSDTFPPGGNVSSEETTDHVVLPTSTSAPPVPLAPPRRNLLMVGLLMLVIAALAGIAVSLYLKQPDNQEQAKTQTHPDDLPDNPAKPAGGRQEKPVKGPGNPAVANGENPPKNPEDGHLPAKPIDLPQSLARPLTEKEIEGFKDFLALTSFGTRPHHPGNLPYGLCRNYPKNAVLPPVPVAKPITQPVGEAVRPVRLIGPHPHLKEIYGIAMSSDGLRAVSCSRDETVKMWDLEKGKQIRKYTDVHNDLVRVVAFAPNDKFFLVGRGGKVSGNGIRQGFDNSIQKLDADDDQEILSFQGKAVGVGTDKIWVAHESWVTSLAVSPDSQLAVSGSNDGWVCLWDVKQGIRMGKWEVGSPVKAVAFSPDGKRIMAGGSDRRVRVWNLETTHEICQFQGHADTVTCVAFCPDEKRNWALSASLDKTIRLWDAATGKELGQFKGHEQGVLSAAMTPDGRWIFSGGDDKTVRLWNVETRQEKYKSDLHTGSVTGVAISAQGDRALSCSVDKTIRLWALFSKP